MDKTRYARAVATKVTQAMANKEISILALSEQSGIPRATLNRRLNTPETSPFSVIELQAIANVLETTAAELAAADNSQWAAA